jgi:hypothetical protein
MDNKRRSHSIGRSEEGGPLMGGFIENIEYGVYEG